MLASTATGQPIWTRFPELFAARVEAHARDFQALVQAAASLSP